MSSEIRTHFYFQLPKYGIFGRKKRKQMLVISIEFRFSTKSIMLRIHLPPPVKSLEITRFQGFLLTHRTRFCTHFGIRNRIAELERAET